MIRKRYITLGKTKSREIQCLKVINFEYKNILNNTFVSERFILVYKYSYDISMSNLDIFINVFKRIEGFRVLYIKLGSKLFETF